MSNQHHHHPAPHSSNTPSPHGAAPHDTATPVPHTAAGEPHETSPHTAAPAPHETARPSSESAPSESALEKEFELERMILFTDAVFAIAITLLIIDIKWPAAARQNNEDLFHHFAPTIFGLVAFATSFLYIGRSWSVHLRLFRLVRRYDQGLINRNLFFLFFIVIFPFANAGLTEHNTVAYVLPVIIYLANLAFLGLAHYRLCKYIIVEKPSLAFERRKAEKNFILLRSRYMMYMTAVTPALAAGLWLLFPERPSYVLFSFAFLFLGLRIAKHRLREHYTADMD